MSETVVDVAIIGSGFGGSLTALLLKRIGLQAVLVERGSHPRFAIGESSTPIANFVLRDLARTYDLPRLEPLAKYGTWQANYSHLVCGLKRGFSYFRQQPERLFTPFRDHRNELLVTASRDDVVSDTHWLRADVDAFLVQEAQAAGVPLYDRTEITIARSPDGWELTGHRLESPVRIRAPFIIDATGEAGIVRRALAIPNDVDQLSTRSRAIYAHFHDMRPWHEILAASGGQLEDHPFYCDHAALHHILDEGWMWQLRFNNGVTSAGFMLDAAQYPLDASQSADQQWNALLERYPSLAAQFQLASIATPPGRLLRSGVLQRAAARMAGADWVLLPNTAGFIDALHSTGIAQTLCGIERLVQILSAHWNKPSLAAELHHYEQIVRRELILIDKLVSGCYLARRDFRLFVAFAMLYFAAATTYEHRRSRQTLPPGAAFLCADDREYCRLVDDLWRRLKTSVDAGTPSAAQVSQFEQQVATAIEPYNHVGLCDPDAQNMYRYTAAPL